MTSVLQFSENAFLKAASKEEDFTNMNNGEFELGAEDYLKSFYADALENEFLDYGLDDLMELARSFWMTGNRRQPGEDIVVVSSARERHGKGRADTRIEIVTDDKAFLVNTIIDAISSLGIDVLGLFHPVASGYRNEIGQWEEDGTPVTESMVLVMIPPQLKRSRDRLQKEIKLSLKDVTAINADFEAMVAAVKTSAEELKSSSAFKSSKSEIEESVAFLNWIAEGNFVHLGARRYNYMKSSVKGADAPDYVNPTIVKGSSLGVLRDPDNQVLRQSSEPSAILSNVKSFMKRSEAVSVAKSNLFSRVHRRVRMDYISIKHMNDDGVVTGETRFVGLFSATAYNKSSMDIPLIRRKVQKVLDRAKLLRGSHNYNRLNYVLSSYPRDELFQISENDLLRISTGIAQAFDRPRTRIFVRRDPFARFVSILVYVPREHYNTRVRERIGDHLVKSFNGRLSAFYPQYSDAPMARVHFIIGLDPDVNTRPDLDDLETEISSLSQPWFENIINTYESSEIDDASTMLASYENAFGLAYQDDFSAVQALEDILICEKLNDNNNAAIKVYEWGEAEGRTIKVKIYHYKDRLEPSYVIPILSNFGLHISQETGYKISRTKKPDIWVQDFEMRLPFTPDDIPAMASVFERAFIDTWYGLNEDDAFNTLVLPQSADWRDIAFLRLLARYRRQSGMDPSEKSQIEALSEHPILTGRLLALKAAKFEPDLHAKMSEREAAVTAISLEIEQLLSGVTSLDHDRVIRRMAKVIMAGLRTNFYQTQENGTVKPYISLKIDSHKVGNLPAPVPYREIYVSSPRVEGVHLRFGPVARGGIRWSDRRDDFRTEVLGLVKAQQIKNTVIVPVGSKGGFYPKKLPVDGDRGAIREEAIASYTVFISSLLDVTDNYKGEGTVAPDNVICWDEPDPYLVVAADKGTATFSDIANGISQSYGFWLDDAFASGGSAGYDHKVMGITARGGWEAVKRHFREMGIDIQSEDFTVIGVGDMSGDVFGNGMLLSKHIKLLAAFNHLDIFIDPNPDAKASFKERQRLFKLPRSTWQDYNAKLISKGGGVFSRTEKSITLSDEIKLMTGLKADDVTPDELLEALLKTSTDLLWFGGIGTYIKASNQSHSEVGDKANDNIRINGLQVKAKVVGEGANLGFTQAGRIEFARHGGRINTDAIDNSAGVDSSDNEVNIKILLGGAIDHKSLKRANRDPLLVEMTDNVAALVLQHNYDQTGALSVAESRAVDDHETYERFMLSLEKEGRLDRIVEGLPGSEIMSALAAEKKGLTRPELSVLMAYSKIKLFYDLIDSNIADDPFMEDTLEAYFPKALAKYDKAMAGHRLKREIIISRLLNNIVDVAGPVFVMRLMELTQGTPVDIAKAFIVAYEALRIGELREDIAALDNKVGAHAQIQLHEEIALVLQRVVAWMVRRNETGALSVRIERRKTSLHVIDSDWLALLSPYDRRRAEARIKRFVKAGIPEDLAADVALLRSRASGFDVIALAEKTGWSVLEAAALFYEVSGRFKIDRIRAALIADEGINHWEKLALRHLQEDFFSAQARFAQSAAEHHISKGGRSDDSPKTIIQNWVKDAVVGMKPYEDAVRSMSRSGDWTVSKFAIVNAQLRELLPNSA